MTNITPMEAQNRAVTAASSIDTTHLDPFRVNKVIPKVLEGQILKALSFYPSLIPVDIRFVFKQRIKGSVMQAQPRIGTMFGASRGYQINISALFRLTHAATPIHQMPFDILVGWIGHELGHIMDYEQRNLWGMVRFGAGYLFSEAFVRKAEQVADTFAVNHGLGGYILQTKHFILDHAALPEKYKRKIARLYLSPDDIVAQVRALEAQGSRSDLSGDK